jgi:hypothetical protein
VSHRLEDAERSGLARSGDEAARPGIDRSIGIGRLRLGKAREVANLLRGIGKRERFGARIETIDGQRRSIRMMGQIEGRDDAEPIRPERVRLFQKADRIVENVMSPMNERRLRIDVEGGAVKPKIVTIVGPQHQAVTKQADRVSVRVFRRVYDANSGHPTS